MKIARDTIVQVFNRPCWVRMKFADGGDGIALDGVTAVDFVEACIEAASNPTIDSKPEAWAIESINDISFITNDPREVDHAKKLGDTVIPLCRCSAPKEAAQAVPTDEREALRTHIETAMMMLAADVPLQLAVDALNNALELLSQLPDAKEAAAPAQTDDWRIDAIAAELEESSDEPSPNGEAERVLAKALVARMDGWLSDGNTQSSVDQSKWTVSHNGQSVTADTLTAAMGAARKLRSEEEANIANANLLCAIEEDNDISPTIRDALEGLLEIEDARIASGAFVPNEEAQKRIDAARAALASEAPKEPVTLDALPPLPNSEMQIGNLHGDIDKYFSAQQMHEHARAARKLNIWQSLQLLFTWPDELHDDSKRLVIGFAAAMACKLAAAERRYGYSNGWTRKGWMDECRQHLLEHLAKGDPRDVANYCAFLWWHNEPTAEDMNGKRYRELRNRAYYYGVGDPTPEALDAKVDRAISALLAVPQKGEQS